MIDAVAASTVRQEMSSAVAWTFCCVMGSTKGGLWRGQRTLHCLLHQQNTPKNQTNQRSRRRHLHFEPSRSGWDTTPISTTG
jgi:hypothetical protein